MSMNSELGGASCLLPDENELTWYPNLTIMPIIHLRHLDFYKT